MISPSVFDWNASISAPSSPARRRTLSSICCRVVEPYISGWRLPSVLRFGPLIRRSFTRPAPLLSCSLALLLSWVRAQFVAELDYRTKRLVVGLALPLLRDVGVYLGGAGAGVTQQLLHDPQLGAPVQQVGCERVTQQVRVDALVQAGHEGVLPHDLLHGAPGQALAVPVREERRLTRAG